MCFLYLCDNKAEKEGLKKHELPHIIVQCKHERKCVRENQPMCTVYMCVKVYMCTKCACVLIGSSHRAADGSIKEPLNGLALVNS